MTPAFVVRERELKKLKLSSLVLDFALYPRMQLDTQHSSAMLLALQAGHELPPPIVCSKSLRVADGFHRIRAWQRFFDDPHTEIECIVKQYKSDADLFLDAMRYNAIHGRNLTQYDRAHSILLAANFGLGDEQIAQALHVPIDKVVELRVDRTAKDDKGLHVPLKRTIRHKAGQKLTKRQQEANKKLGGMNQIFYVNQVIELLEANLLDTSNESLMQRIAELHQLLENTIHAKA